MHEFSLAINLVEIVSEEAMKFEHGIVDSIEIEVGSLSGVVLDALQTALSSAIKGTILELADINITEVLATGHCQNCGHEFAAESFMSPCPLCNEFNVEMIQGKELKVKSITFQT